MLFWTELKVWHKVIFEWAPHEIITSEHLKVAMGKGLSKVSMKNLMTWNMLSGQTFREVDKFEEAEISVNNYDYLYNDSEWYHFMNRETYEQVALSKKTMWWAELFLNEGDKVMLQEFNGEPINVRLDATAILEVIETPPGEKWNTATWGKKPATLSTGLVVQVPLFINVWDKLKIGTVDKSYQSRA